MTQHWLSFRENKGVSEMAIASREELRGVLERITEDDVRFLFFPRTTYKSGHPNVTMSELFDRACLFILTEDDNKACTYLDKLMEYVEMGLEKDDPRAYFGELVRYHYSEPACRALMWFELQRFGFFTHFLRHGHRADNYLQEAVEVVQPWVDWCAASPKAGEPRYAKVYRAARIIFAGLLTEQVERARDHFELLVRPLPSWPRKSLTRPEREEAALSVILSFLSSETKEKRPLFEECFEHFFRLLRGDPFDHEFFEGPQYLISRFKSRMDYALFRGQYITGETDATQVVRSLSWFEG